MRGIGLALGFVGLLGMATTAAADEDRGLYLGGGVGMWDYDVNSFSNVALPSGYSDSAAVWRALVGYQINKWLAVQGDYLWYGRLQQNTTQTNSRQLYINADGAEASAKLSWPLGEHFEVFGRVGYQWYNIDAKLQYVKGQSDSDDALMYAGGVAFNFTKAFSLNAEYESLDIDEGDIWIATLNAVYRFHR